MEKDYYKELISELKRKRMGKQGIAKLKRKLARKHNLNRFPTDIEIFLNAKPEDIKHLRQLQTKPVRSISGVAVIAVMTKPIRCPHGKCSICPGGPGSDFGDVPQSYTGKEPATMRAVRAGYNPYFQVFNRLEQYVVSGHVPDKAELIIMGGTFQSFPKAYRDWFVKECFRAMNDFSSMFFSRGRIDIMRFREFFELPGEVGNPERTRKIHTKLRGLRKWSRMEREQKRNEKAGIRCVGMTIETRPDHAGEKEGDEMLRLGCTRVELGVQSVHDDVLERMERGHDVRESIKATRLLRDLGFKINYHYMLGLPGSGRKKDIEGLKKLFDSPDFRPDMLKIYPCMVVRGTKLYDRWRKGRFRAMTTQEAAEIITEFKKSCPEYVRIMRVQRDIPTYATEAGVDRTNLRQLIQEEMERKGIKCRCIRCREAGRTPGKGRARIMTTEYDASEGKEFFIAAEKGDSLLGFCRMRFPSQSLRKEITDASALIRELHVYGEAAGIGKKGRVQHRGIGRKLLKRAEAIAGKKGKRKIVVISGVGAREYYRKLGYRREGAYMVRRV